MQGCSHNSCLFCTYFNVAKSIVGHFFTGNVRGGYTNPKNLTLKKTAYSLKKGKTATIAASVSKVNSSKALATSHAAKLRFISNNPKVAAVNAGARLRPKPKAQPSFMFRPSRYLEDLQGVVLFIGKGFSRAKEYIVQPE